MTGIKRLTGKRKQELVLRLLRGESLGAVIRETGVPAGDLSSWWDEFLGGRRCCLKRRSEDANVDGLEQELKRTPAKLGELMMDKELLGIRVARCEGKPLLRSGDRIDEPALLGPPPRVYGKVWSGQLFCHNPVKPLSSIQP